MHVYYTTYLPNHHRSWKDGRVYTHILVAEQKLGRELKDGEVVHHIDLDKHNNTPDNLMVFASENDHKAYHSGANAHLNDDGSWYCDQRIFVCGYCGTQFKLTSGRKVRDNMYCCKECFYKSQAKIDSSINDIISELHSSNGNFSAVGRKYGVSPNAIVNLCKRNNLPYHSRNYKKKAKKRTKAKK